MDNLAELYSDAGKWGLAQPLYEEGLRLMRAKLGDNNPVTLDTSQGLAELYLKQATHQVWFNRRKAYAESCQRALELAKNSSDPTTLERAAKICSLCPDADPPRVADAVALARKAVELGKHHGNLHWFQTALGISEFRAGHLAQSDAALGAAMKGGIENPHIWTTCAFYRSMALFHLGKNAEARKLAAEATSKMQAVRPFPRQQKTTYGHDDLVLWMAYKEAVHLLHLDSLAPEKLADDSEAAESLQNLAEVHLAAAASQAWSGQVKEYAETCRRALELAKGSEDPTTLERVSKACLLRPGNDAAVLATSLSFARKAVDRGKGHPYAHFFLMSLGMAEFRSGHWAEADSAFVAAMKDVSDTSHIWLTSTFYRAMTLFRQGKSDEARKLANEAQSIMKPLPRDDEEDLGHDDLIVWMAYKEAKDLLKLETTSPSSAQRVGK
jgi:tetratricopeptide (TPR) repeat protein